MVRGALRVHKDSDDAARAIRPSLSERWYRYQGVVTAVLSGVIMVAMTWAAVRWLATSPHFRVRHIEVRAASHQIASTLETRLTAYRRLPIFRVSMESIERECLKNPWVVEAHARRELPGAIVVEVIERNAVALVDLGELYWADEDGSLFKRLETSDPPRRLPIITGFDRNWFLESAKDAARQIVGLANLAAQWRKNSDRPTLSEIHIDKLQAVTFFFTGKPLALKLGQYSNISIDRFSTFDVVWRELQHQAGDAKIIFLDGLMQPERVIVRFREPKTDAAVPTATTKAG